MRQHRPPCVVFVALMAALGACQDPQSPVAPLLAAGVERVTSDGAGDRAISVDAAAVMDARAADQTAADRGAPADATATDIPRGEVNAAACIDWAAISTEALRSWLARLTGEETITQGGQVVSITERATATGRARARAFLRAEYEAMGYTVTEPAYETGINLEASGPGTEGDLVMIGGHYDTVPGVPGADDNGSGLAATLAAARALRSCRFPRGLRFLAFDEEEKGGVGSRAYAKALRDAGQAARVVGLFNLDMLGHDANDDGGFIVIDCDRQENLPLTEAVLAQARALPGLTPRKTCAAGGDHRAFWDARIPAIHFGEEFFVPAADDNPCYHRPCDRLDRINLGYLAKLSRLAAGAAADLAQR